MTEPEGRELSVVDGKFSLVPRNLTEAMKFAELMAKSDVVPQSYHGKPGNIIIAVQLGQEIGLQPLQALQNIAVINGRPTVWGQGCAGLIVSSPVCEYLKLPSTDEVRRTKKAVVAAKRRGHPDPAVGTFGEADARDMKLDGRPTYQTDWPSMYLWRAFHRATKILFADVLKGILPREVADDYVTIGRTDQGAEIQRPREGAAPQPKIDDRGIPVNDPGAILDNETPNDEADAEPVITPDQITRLFTIIGKRAADLKVKRADLETGLRNRLKAVYGVESSKAIKATWYDDIVAWVEGMPGPEMQTTEPGANG